MAVEDPQFAARKVTVIRRNFNTWRSGLRTSTSTLVTTAQWLVSCGYRRLVYYSSFSSLPFLVFLTSFFYFYFLFYLILFPCLIGHSIPAISISLSLSPLITSLLSLCPSLCLSIYQNTTSLPTRRNPSLAPCITCTASPLRLTVFFFFFLSSFLYSVLYGYLFALSLLAWPDALPPIHSHRSDLICPPPSCGCVLYFYCIFPLFFLFFLLNPVTSLFSISRVTLLLLLPSHSIRKSLGLR